MNLEAKGTFVGLVEEKPGVQLVCWSARLVQLVPGHRYYYALESNGTSERWNFQATSIQDEITWAVFGDLATFSQGCASAISWKALTEDRSFDAVLNIGDIAYEFTQTTGKTYMESFTPITLRVPMQITTGNHEYANDKAPFYTLRNFHRHFAGQYTDGEWIRSEESRRPDGNRQLKWFEQDLARVDRKKTPYIVVAGHRPHFTSPEGLDDSGNLFGPGHFELEHCIDRYGYGLFKALGEALPIQEQKILFQELSKNTIS